MIKENKEPTLSLNEGRSVYVYDGEDFDFVKKSNTPHFNVEDHKNWKGYNNAKPNPNLIGQIHSIDKGVVFHLCYSPAGEILTKDDLKAIIKGIEYIEEFKELKKKVR